MLPKGLHKYKGPLNLSSWFTFAISLTLYWITADPDISYWDCPEYVTTASKMEIGHPPGNPVWMLAMRTATMAFDPIHHAYVINLCSGLFMAFASFFLCRIIYILLVNFLGGLNHKRKFETPTRNLSILSVFISIGASLCFAFCDSIWFSAVEAEVYAMSTFLMAVSLWVMTLWWFEEDAGARGRLLILTAYLTGLSLGVHQLNLLLIPVYALIILYKTHPEKLNPLMTIVVIFLAGMLIALILIVLLPGMLYAVGAFELFGVNIMGLPYNSGEIAFCVLILLLFGIIFLFISKSESPLYRFLYKKSSGFFYVSTMLWMLGFILLGFSSFGIIQIRASAYPPMNEGVPDNIFSLNSYISRDQYPSQPLIYGATPYSRPLFIERFENGRPSYSRYILKKGKGKYAMVSPEAKFHYRSNLVSPEDSLVNLKIRDEGRGYVLTDYNFSQKLTPELDMWFSRITSSRKSDILAYEDWADMKKDHMERVHISETIDSVGNYVPRMYSSGSRPAVFSYRPTYTQNLKYFISYQAYYMYFRYLFWNFIGRQNDYHSMGEIEHGNFITGFPFIDKYLIGDTTFYPPELFKENKGRNRYFGIPFILGLLGIAYMLSGKKPRRRVLTIVTIFFLMTGLAIVVYLNQTPGEPRERDYTFIGSYMAFSIWIAAGLFSISRLLLKFIPTKIGFVLACLVSLSPATLMAMENFDDHDRSGRFEPAFYTGSLLDLERPSIIFSHGDNSTFPLWYATEVLKKGASHTVIDITYLGVPSYVANLKKQGDKGITTILSTPEILYDAYIFTKIPHDTISYPMPIKDAIKGLKESDKEIPEWPTSLIKLPVSVNDSVVINLHEFSNGSSYLSFRHLMLLDIIAAQQESIKPKDLVFPNYIDYSFYKPLAPYLTQGLSGKIYAPQLTETQKNKFVKNAVEIELDKLSSLKTKLHYVDPLIADRSRRYRGELIMSAEKLLEQKDTATVLKILEAIDMHYPYDTLLPGDFTVCDTTYYEGPAYLSLLDRLTYESEMESISKKRNRVDSILTAKHQQWLKFYNSLSPQQRKTLSNRSKRALK